MKIIKFLKNNLEEYYKFTLFIYCLLILFLCISESTPYFMTNDDVGMLAEVSGVIFGSIPSSLMLFSNTFYGEVLYFFYKIFPAIPWYGLFSIAFIFLSIYAISITIYKKTKDIMIAMLLLAIFISVIGVTIITKIQFTMVAGLATLAGGLLILSIPTKSKLNYLGFFLLLIGSLVRFKFFLLISAIILIVFFINFIFERKANFLFIFFLSICFLVKVTSDLYDSYLGNTEYIEYNTHRASISDFKNLDRISKKECKRLLEEVNWNNRDLLLLKTWFFADTSKYSIEKIRYLSTNAKKSAKINWKLNINKTKKYVQNTFKRQKYLLGYLCILLLFIYSENKIRFIVGAVSSVIIFAAVILYLNVFLKPPPLRIEYILVSMLLLLPYSFNKEIIFKNKSIWMLIMVISILTNLHFNFKKNANMSAMSKRVIKKLDYINNQEDTLFVKWGTALWIQFLSPFSDLSKYDKCDIIPLGSRYYTPKTNRALEKYNVDDLELALATRDDVVLIITKKKKRLVETLFVKIIKEKHGIDITPTVVKVMNNTIFYNFEIKS